MKDYRFTAGSQKIAGKENNKIFPDFRFVSGRDYAIAEALTGFQEKAVFPGVFVFCQSVRAERARK